MLINFVDATNNANRYTKPIMPTQISSWFDMQIRQTNSSCQATRASVNKLNVRGQIHSHLLVVVAANVQSDGATTSSAAVIRIIVIIVIVLSLLAD